nr:Ig-like domain-containing protein [Microbacterium trichothecenolyticum]
MRSFIELLRRKRAAMASGATLTVAAVAISTLAVLHPGVPTADLELDDGGVWVTKTSDLLVGHLNYPSRLLDGALRTRAPQYDVLQDGDRVAVFDSANSTLTTVDPAAVALGQDLALPPGTRVGMGAATIGVLADGRVFTFAPDAAAPVFDADSARADVGDGGAIAVSRSGAHVVAVSPRDKRMSVLASDSEESASVDLADLSPDAELSATAVGESGVALDAHDGVVYLPSGSAVTVPDGAGALLQQAGDGADAVYIATPTSLLRQPLGGGEPEQVASVPRGRPSPPVWLDGCVYAVWSGTGAYVRDCPGDGDDVDRTIETTADASLVLRTNRHVVVVNDTMAGTVWVVDQNVQRIENWDEVVPPADDNAQEEQSQDDKPQFDIPQRTAQNTPPTAVDDQYGVRAGRTTILRVTENDSDPDGDLLAASLVSEPPTGWDVQSVLGGAALQAAVPANATGTFSLRYRDDDGRGGTAEATATVTVRPPDVNAAPVQKRVDTVLVEAGASITYGVLDAWSDPDGDDVFLQHASVEGGDLVTFRSNGVVEYTAATAQTGIHEVKLVVSDGRESTEGVLRVDVRPTDTLNPVANADRVTAVAGVPVTVAPLDNDISPTGRPLRLSKYDAVPGTTITPDFAGGTFDFTAEQPGTYYVQYLVTDGPHSAVGIVRIDVVTADSSPLPPVAVRDLALLPVGRQTLVDVLANDVDPAGGILVVQSARVAPNAGVSVEVLEHRILRITDLSGLSAPVTLTYNVSNGSQSATGEVLVMPVPLPAQVRPPVTVDDTAIVRVGDVVSVPVLANDYSPDNDILTLEPALVETDAADKSAIFVDGDRIRFQAGAEPGTVHATYEVSDSQQNRTAGYLTIQVLPADQGSNSAPRPKPVTARVVAGNTVRIPVPLDGIDPDGDSVELVGVASNPSKGTVTTGDSWFVYEAYPDATGRDTFTYTVRDRLGAQAQSTVVVGVAAPGLRQPAPVRRQGQRHRQTRTPGGRGRDRQRLRPGRRPDRDRPRRPHRARRDHRRGARRTRGAHRAVHAGPVPDHVHDHRLVRREGGRLAHGHRRPRCTPGRPHRARRSGDAWTDHRRADRRCRRARERRRPRRHRRRPHRQHERREHDRRCQRHPDDHSAAGAADRALPRRRPRRQERAGVRVRAGPGDPRAHARHGRSDHGHQRGERADRARRSRARAARPRAARGDRRLRARRPRRRLPAARRRAHPRIPLGRGLLRAGLARCAGDRRHRARRPAGAVGVRLDPHQGAAGREPVADRAQRHRERRPGRRLRDARSGTPDP